MTLAAEDCMCPICMCILVEPVTMPCKHTLCYPCFKQNVEEASLACPMCRVRISVWARRGAKNGTLVNKKLWSQIQQLFPEKVEKRQKGLDDSIDEPVFQPLINIAEPGEIRKEYEEQMKRLEAQREEERKKEQEASEALIRQLEEEEARRKELENRDRELAKEISQEVNQSINGDDSVAFVGDDAAQRQTRSTSSTSSCSASSSRPPSTIDSLLRKMREAEKLKAADVASRKASSPYPYKCYSPTEKASKQKKGKENGGASPFLYKRNDSAEKLTQGRDIVSRNLSSAGLSSRSCTSVSEMGNAEDDDDDDEDLPSKYVSLGLPSLETAIGNISDRSDGEIFDKDSVEVIERCRSSESMDSISQEISHFRPIRVCPLTPPRKLPSGKVVEAPLIRTTPRNLSKTEFGSPVRTLSDLDASSPIMQRRLSELEEERKTNVNKLSKSTSTETKKDTKKSKVVTLTRDHDYSGTNKGNSDHDYSAVVIDLEADNHEDSSLNESKEDSGNPEEKSDTNKYKLKKLVIPLEPTFNDNDFDIPPMKENNPQRINSDTITVVGKQSPILTKSKSEQDTSVRKKVQKLSGKAKLALSSPQRTITDWIKQSAECSGQNNFHLEPSGRDDVDGEPVRKVKKGQLVSVTPLGDCPRRKEKRHKKVKSYPKRERKPYNPDPMWTFVSAVHKSQHVDMDESSKDSSVFNGVLDEQNVERKEVSNLHSKKRTATSMNDEKPKKRRKVTEKATVRSKLKQTSSKAKLKSVQHSQAKNPILNFCSQSNLKRVKDAIKNNQLVDEEADFRVSDGDRLDKETQEMMDRKLAEELAKQYEMEVKSGFRFFKLKGTSEEYNFRRKPKLST
ncbi:E3 ubiquitin-protein ligase RNF169-like [Saccostrea echinata]|uniref:E3 ubiquitin-protein ligase RNF169-like n=1 Tax=Saccostrea echinata TaxID=191078 RepID=UPI002A81799F|nr:E3 ubiquitin-protein ligase RNF169-like [Saccostrea echinata]